MPLLNLQNWTGLGVGAAAALFVVLLSGRFLFLRHQLKAARKRLSLYWEGYLDSLGVSLANLKDLRAVLASFRPPSDRLDLIDAGLRLYRAVSQEIQRIEKTLTDLAETPDRKWHAMAIPWKAVLSLEQEMREVLALLLHRSVCGTEPAADGDGEIARLRQEIEALLAKIAQLESPGRMQAPRLSVDVDEKQVQQDRPGQLDENVAARLMRELEDNLSADLVEARLATAEGEIAYCRNRLEDSDTQEEVRAGLKARMEWMEQVRRWWVMQRKLRQHADPLDASAQTTMGPSDEEMRERAGQQAEFQAVEAQNAQLRQRVAELLSANRQLGIRLDDLSEQNCSVEQLQETIRQLMMAHKRSERELEMLSKMMDDMESDLVRARHTTEQLKERELASKALEESARQTESSLAEIKREHAALKRSTEAEKVQYQKMLEMLEKRLEKESRGRQEMETENLELQNAYDELKSQMQQMKSALVQADQGAAQAREELTRLEREYQEMQNRYRSLRDEYAEVCREMGGRESVGPGEG